MHRLALLLCCLAVAPSAAAQPATGTRPADPGGAAAETPTLLIGDKAPPLTIDAWIRGKPVESFQKGRVYVVEFWATWCAPCERSIPRLSALQARFRDKGLTVIGVSSLDTEGIDKVRSFVESRADAMAYSVALDKNQATDRAWRGAARITAIPAAFVVDKDGLVAWLGFLDSASALDETVEAVLAGTYDTRAIGAMARKAQAIMSRADQAWNNDRQRQALEILDELLALDKKRYAEAARVKLRALAVQVGDSDAAYAYGLRLVDEVYSDDASTVASIARVILELPAADQRFQDLALRAAARASQLAGNKDASMLATLAEVHFQRGDPEKAAAFQAMALSAASDALKPELRQRLDAYRRDAQVRKKQ